MRRLAGPSKGRVQVGRGDPARAKNAAYPTAERASARPHACAGQNRPLDWGGQGTWALHGPRSRPDKARLHSECAKRAWDGVGTPNVQLPERVRGLTSARETADRHVCDRMA